MNLNMDIKDRVVVCIPYYKGQKYIRRAVKSILDQTYKNLLLVVVNDGDFQTPPWPLLADIIDKRLIRYDLAINHGGPFYANAVVLNAVKGSYFLVQEQDDWSEPTRIEELLYILLNNKADIAISGQQFYEENRYGSESFIGLRWHNPINYQCRNCATEPGCLRCYVDIRLTERFKLRAPHTSLFKTEILKMIGGYYWGFNLHHDTLIMNLVFAIGKVTHTPKPLYNRLFRGDSLTQIAKTGETFGLSKQENQEMSLFYNNVFHNYRKYLLGKISCKDLIDSISTLSYYKLPLKDRHDLSLESERLRNFV